jgi:SAM-dependent methyltransferase
VQHSLLDYIACPECGNDLDLTVEAADGSEVMDGTLVCNDCGKAFPIIRGVPRMNVHMDDLEAVARVFGYEWKAHHRGEIEADTVFGYTRDQDWSYVLTALGFTETDLDDKVMLDAGCGSARLTQQLAERPGSVVIGVDVNEAVDEAFATTRDIENLHIVQGNIFALPLKPRIFDVVWSNGVIHHTPDAAGAHRSLARHVAPGGRMYVWVYAKRFNPFRFTKDVFDALRVSRLPEPVLMRISHLISYPSLALLNVYRAIRSLPGLRPRGAWGRRTVRPRTIKELQLTWFDALAPEYDSRHTEAEVIEWFRHAGFEDIEAIEEPKVGVRGVAPQSVPSAVSR